MSYVVCALKPNKRKPYWYRADISGEIVDIHADDLARFKITEEQELNDEDFLTLKKSSASRILYEKAIQKLALKLHSRAELSRHLSHVIYKNYKDVFSKEESLDVIENILTRVAEKNYLNDQEFSINLIAKRQRQSKPLGQRAILQELYAKGVKTREIEEYLNASAQDVDLENAKKYVAKLGPKLEHQKLIGRLMARGFDYSTTIKAISETAANEV